MPWRTLTARPWPGNVRELKNLCRRLMLMAPGRIVHKSDLGDVWISGRAPREERRRLAPGSAGLGGGGAGRWPRRAVGEALPEFEKILLDAALAKTGGQRQEAAKLLGWGRNTLTRKLKDHGELEIQPAAQASMLLSWQASGRR